ncbi:PA domain protein [Leptospira meyeri serovar Semaranga str. Veldrot Semarang 173]|nr:PA domain protein [Leptospira meyeri serovar Semaranga str. Veldrot Semarang 173]
MFCKKKFVVIFFTLVCLVQNCEVEEKKDLSAMLLLFATPTEGSPIAEPIDNGPTSIDFAYAISDMGAGNTFSISPSALQPATGVSFSVTPALPTGLSLSANTGIISGTPTSYAIRKDYDIKGQLGASSKVVRVNFGVGQFENISTGLTIPSNVINANATYNITAQADVTNPTDACATITNNLTGKVALVRRGFCSFFDKAQRVIASGAVAIIHYDNSATDTIPVITYGGSVVNLPSIIISGNAGGSLATAINNGSVNVTLRR